MGNKDFKWIPFYMELADKLLEYKNDLKSLTKLIYNNLDIRDTIVFYEKATGTRIYKIIDPFTIYSSFNRKVNNRAEIAQILKDVFEIKAEVPQNFEGIPIQDNRTSSYVERKLSDADKKNDAKRLWTLFVAALEQDDDILGVVFDKVLKQKGVGIAKLTMGLYYIRPYEYLALDDYNVNYLSEYGIDIKPDKMKYADYAKLLKDLKKKMKNKSIEEQTFPEFSAAAVEDNSEEGNNQIIEECVDLLYANSNLIVTGAPGTGKTYLAKQIAKKIGCTENEIEFVQFHPSYDYTDFVEGLRPIKENGYVGFKRIDGVFKAFCAKALINQSVDSSITNKLNENPIVWKVSLAGTGKNDVRKDCLDNGYIRIGWHEYGDVEDFNDFNDFNVGGKNVLRAFQSQMKEGDLIASCFSENEVDAIGVVTGNYEYNAAFGEYPRFRKVDWLVKGITENIIGINGNRKFTLSTVYKSNITSEDALNIVKKYNHQAKIEDRPFVFIIDEINRGEINKIFGELFFSVEPSYRGENGRVNTQYQNMVEEGDLFKKGFYIPENVYIIGTMNDIDRSVESMDFAFRRRFAFKEVSAKESQNMLYEEKAWDGQKPDDDIIEEIVGSMDGLNNAIWHKTEDGDVQKCCENMSAAYHIGASYFLKLAKYRNEKGLYDENSFEKLWKYHLEGLLREYLRGTPSVDEIIDKLKDAYDLNTDDDDDSTSDNGQPE